MADNLNVEAATGVSPETLEELGRLSHGAEGPLHEVKQTVTAAASEHGLEFLGSGSGRLAYRTPDGEYVVKFPLTTEFDDGREQLRTELVILDALPAHHAHRFVPYVAHGDGYYWGVQPLAEPVEEETEAAVVAMIDSFHYLPHQSEFLLPENIGWYDGGYRLFDYGSYVPRQFVVSELGDEYVDEIGEERLA